MSYNIIKQGKHLCHLGPPETHGPGTVIECAQCGKWWRSVIPGNPAYNYWKRAWIRQMFKSDTRCSYTVKYPDGKKQCRFNRHLGNVHNIDR